MDPAVHDARNAADVSSEYTRTDLKVKKASTNASGLYRTNVWQSPMQPLEAKVASPLDIEIHQDHWIQKEKEETHKPPQKSMLRTIT